MSVPEQPVTLREIRKLESVIARKMRLLSEAPLQEHRELLHRQLIDLHARERELTSVLDSTAGPMDENQSASACPRV